MFFIFTQWVKTETGNETVLHPVFIGYTPGRGYVRMTELLSGYVDNLACFRRFRLKKLFYFQHF